MDKDSQIRLTIREYILPLIHAIYDDDPVDVTLYCFGYFERLLREKESRDISDGAVTCLRHPNYKGVKEPISKEKGVSEATDNSRPNLQGSASDPLLMKDKHSERLCLRETSSWDIASSSSCDDVPREVMESSLADAMSKIGDQPCSKPMQEEGSLEKDAKAGDTYVNKEKELENDNFTDNPMSNSKMRESKEVKTENEDTLPSAPPYSSLEGEVSRGEETNKEAVNVKNNRNLNASETAYTVSENLESDASGIPNALQHPCSSANVKQLSPNSSFGFIPHLKRYESEEECKDIESRSWEDFIQSRKAEEQIRNLSKKLSLSFNPLAKEFNSAVTNFNTEFKNAREISEVIPSRLQIYDSKEAGSEDDETNDYLEVDRSDQGFELVLNKSPDKIPENVEDGATNGQPNFSPKDDCSEHQLESVLSKFRNAIYKDLNIHKKEIGKEDDDTAKKTDENTKGKDSRSDNFEPRQTLHESWRRRWYEVHPFLDDLHADLQLKTSLREHQKSFMPENNSNESIYNIGEAGDLPSDGTVISECPSHFELNNPEEVNKKNSNRILVKENNSASSVSSDESSRSATTGRSNVSSQNIPYSWRQMCRKQVSSVKNEAKNFKQSSNPKEKEANLKNAHVAHESESLSEAVTESEVNAANNDSLKGCRSDVEKTNEKPETQEKLEKDDAGDKKLANDEFSGNQEAQKEQFYFELDAMKEPSDEDAADTGNKMNSETKMPNENAISSDVSQDGSESRMYGPEKVEPGLNLASGDFVVDMNDGNHEEELNPQPPDGNTEENAARNTEDSDCLAEERLEGIIDMVAEQQEDEFQDSFEGLYFSSYSESEDMSSDFSEAEEVSII